MYVYIYIYIYMHYAYSHICMRARLAEADHALPEQGLALVDRLRSVFIISNRKTSN